tara:strand:+ start:196 stop:741 length:546 start_codon:yes stop_codon:yes gene_type:complete
VGLSIYNALENISINISERGTFIYMEPFTKQTQGTHQIYASDKGLSYTITGKDGKREGFIKYDSVESVYVESISRQSRFTFVWLAMLVVLIFIAMAALDGFLMKMIALSVFTLMGSFLLFDHYSQEIQPCLVIQSNGFSAKFPLEKDLADYELRDLMGTVLEYIDTHNSINTSTIRVFIPR